MLKRPSGRVISAAPRAGAWPAAGELHVWRASLDWPQAVVAELVGLLSEDEQRRADRFRYERHRSRFIAGRGLLRMLLSRYLGTPAAALRFGYGPNEKPWLASPGPWFNLSHSGDVALYAFSSQVEIGIDIELATPDAGRERIAEHFFSAAEVRRLRSLPRALQPTAFLQCWTRKEAFIKARGDGLSLPLDSFTVAFGPDAPPAVLHTSWSRDEPGRWTMFDLSEPDEGFVAALATRSSGLQVSGHRVAEIVDNSILIDQEG